MRKRSFPERPRPEHLEREREKEREAVRFWRQIQTKIFIFCRKTTKKGVPPRKYYHGISKLLLLLV